MDENNDQNIGNDDDHDQAEATKNEREDLVNALQNNVTYRECVKRKDNY